MRRITIIGGGASGTLLAVNLLRNAGSGPLEINFIERSSRLGRGVAYGTVFSSHLLNVPAGRMGGFPDDVGNFHRWLAEKGHAFAPDDFVPRMLFGEYLQDLLRTTATYSGENVTLRFIDDEAVDVTDTEGSSVVSLRNGGMITSDKVILAFGNFAPPHPNVPDLAFTASDRYFQDPWSPRLYESISPDDSIFVIGTGLSMVDVALHLKKTGHRGKISAISTRGMLPAVHKLGYSYPSFADELAGMTRITDLLKAVRRHVEKAASDGSNWRAVIDSLRPATQQIWRDLPVAEKRYFMQHLSRYWNVARHRMPAEAAAVLDEMCSAGSLEILRGRLKNIFSNGKFEIAFTENGIARTASADVLVNCIGSQSDFRKIDSDLVRNLLAAGRIRCDELSIGLDADPDGTVRDAEGRTSDRLFTLGTALRGILWETTAIPEIRTQARDLALKLLAN